MEQLIKKALAKLNCIKDCTLVQLDKFSYSITYDGLKPRLIGEKIIKELESSLAKEGWAIFVEEANTSFITLIAEKIR